MLRKKLGASVLVGLTLLGLSNVAVAKAASKSQSSEDILKKIATNHKSDAGKYFIENYKTNLNANQSPDTNASVDLLSQMSKYWQPGTDWNNGKQLNTTILHANLDRTNEIAKNRIASESAQAWLDDRNDMDYSVQEGLGDLTDFFRQNAGVTGGYTSVPADVVTKDYPTNWGDKTVTGDPNSKLGKMVQLVDLLKDGTWSSSASSKLYFKYPRPFRWDGDTITNAQDNGVIMLTQAISAKADSVNDYGFPSGHTNSSYLTAFALAYAFPQRFQQLITRASLVGQDRIVAGRHSVFDVMGGRVLGTALAASILNDPANQALMKQAYDQAQSTLKDGKVDDNTYNMNDAATNATNYNYRLTYGMPKIANSKHVYIVPKGAEVLLATRLPYLSAAQRRAVLATTELPTGYPLLDDGEGWGRLNLYNAANGYGQFVSNTTVNMDAKKGLFNAKDTWKNDISGVGKLTKEGTGELTLTGKNTYQGGNQINGGTLEAANNQALGTGNVNVNKGQLKLSAVKVTVKGNYQQGKHGKTSIARNGQFVIAKNAKLGGTLILNDVKNGSKVLTYGKHTGKFSKVLGLRHGLKIVYKDHGIQVIKK